jgi:hypothetical protein
MCSLRSLACLVLVLLRSRTVNGLSCLKFDESGGTLKLGNLIEEGDLICTYSNGALCAYSVDGHEVSKTNHCIFRCAHVCWGSRPGGLVNLILRKRRTRMMSAPLTLTDRLRECYKFYETIEKETRRNPDPLHNPAPLPKIREPHTHAHQTGQPSHPGSDLLPLRHRQWSFTEIKAQAKELTT